MITAHHLYTLKKIVFTLLAVLLSAFLFVILVTYTPNDPSWSRISSDMGQVSNMGGSVGAWLSDLLYTFLGWPAWWLMAFLSYEAICLWWSRDQAFGPLRAIAYVFLVLASCGLTAVTPQLLGFSTDNGARFGGILGAEVATRLASLLTVYGAAAFLLVFSLITVTFAFDIHWERVFKQIFSLSWLGSGIRRSSAERQEAIEEGHDLTEEEQLASQEVLDDAEQPQTESPLFQQLKLSLPESSEEQEEAHLQQPQTTQKSDPALSNVLDDFLVNSGLTESILALREQEAQQQHADSQAQQQIAQQPVKTEAVVKKQEPSFAWNDQNVINELLDEQALPVTVANRPETPSASQPQEVAAQSEAEEPQTETTAVVDQTSVQDEATIEVENESVEVVTKDVEEINERDNVEATETQPAEIEAEIEQPQPTAVDTDTDFEQDDFEVEASDDPQPEPETAAEEWGSEDAAAQLDEELDLTPTNTPPSNPKKPHEPSSDKNDAPTREMPTIRFATPEGGASNHIEDMVPDSDDADEAEVSLPEIHDDSAFASSSRAMQTAKYRESFTPIPALSILDKPDPDRKPSYTEAELKQLSELL